MTDPLLQRFDHFARSLFPFIITVALTLITAAPLRAPEAAAILPSLTLIAVFHFTIRHPRLLPYWASFLIGLLQDLIAGTTLGVSAIILIFVQLVIRSQYRFFATASFPLGWSLFFFLAAGAFLADWVFNSLGLARFLDGGPAFFRYLLTVALYPVLTLILIKGEKLFQEQDER